MGHDSVYVKLAGVALYGLDALLSTFSAAERVLFRCSAMTGRGVMDIHMDLIHYLGKGVVLMEYRYLALLGAFHAKSTQ
jgi:hypothetical protein